MSKCWKCKKQIEKYQIHHIDGNHENNNFNNKVYLCEKCHNLIQGICDKCQNQTTCFASKFHQCWNFEDTLPPIYFKIKVVGGEKSCKMMLNLDINKNLIGVCLKDTLKGKFNYPCIFQNEHGCLYEKISKITST